MSAYPHLVVLFGTAALALAGLSILLLLLLARSRRSLAAVREADGRFRSLYDNLHEGVFRCSLDGVLTAANPAVARLHGYDSEKDLLEQAFGMAGDWYVDPVRHAEIGEALARTGRVDGCISEVYRHRTRERIWVEESIRLVRNNVGRPQHLEGTVRDITDTIRWLELQQRSEKIASVIKGCLYQLRIHPDGRMSVPYISVGIVDLLGLTPEEVQRDPDVMVGLFHPDERETLLTALRTAGLAPSRRFDYRVLLRDGSVRWMSSAAVGEREVDGSILWHGFFTDVTDRKQAEERIAQLAFADSLTGLPNRTILAERLQETLDQSEPLRWHALLFIDLDQFKVLNDSKGHHVGDALLVEIAGRLRAAVDKGDLVARLGGDEFVVVMRDLAIVPEVAEQQVMRRADAMHATIADPVLLEGFPFRTTASIGVALFRSGGDLRVEEILKRADAAMYEAKAAGTGGTAFFAASMQAVLEERLVLTADLREALEQGLLTVYYQPQVDDRGEVFGVEALLRWDHPQRGMIPPAVFIPLAERAGLGEQINAFVIGSACATLARWAGHADLAKLQMAVNVGGRRLGDDLVEIVTDGLALSGVDPERLTVELTEQVMLDNGADLDAAFSRLKKLGVKIFLDDFGTGYSSLSHLRRLPIDALKIDCSFVRDIETDQNDRVIVQTILNIARNLGLSVVAEGVENEMQGLLLRRFGCRAFQGFLYGKPMPLGEFEARYVENAGQASRSEVMAPSRMVV